MPLPHAVLMLSAKSKSLCYQAALHCHFTLTKEDNQIANSCSCPVPSLTPGKPISTYFIPPILPILPSLAGAYLFQLSLPAGKRKGEAKGQLLMHQVFSLHEICQTVSYVLKQLQTEEGTGHRAQVGSAESGQGLPCHPQGTSEPFPRVISLGVG